MSDIRGRVRELPQVGDTKYAYLYGFKIDGAEPRREHKSWLDSNLMLAAQIAARPPAQLAPVPPMPDLIWHVWLCGTTSRTAGFSHNLGLSKKRATAVEAYITSQFASQRIRVKIDSTWFGEMPATLTGHANNVENPLHRAVIVAFKAVRPAPAPAPVKPPPPVSSDPYFLNPCCYVKQQIEYVEAVRDVFSMVLAKGGAGKPPQRSFSGDQYGTSDVPRMSLDTTDAYFLRRWLHGKGWDDDRAAELSVDPTYTVIRIDGLEEHIRKLDRELDYLKDLIAERKCSPGDDLDICQIGHFRKNNNHPDVPTKPGSKYQKAPKVDQPIVIQPGPSGGKQE